MKVLDQAQNLFDKGVSTAKNAVSGVAISQISFIKNIIRLCDNGFNLGWHEQNGGNISYRLKESEVENIRPFFYSNDNSWVIMEQKQANLAKDYFLVTRAGSFIGNIKSDIEYNLGILELNDQGNAWRIVWGLKDNGNPTSEIFAHFMSHAKIKEKSQGSLRVIYHSHPSNIVALSILVPPNSKTVTKILWKTMPECLMTIPDGVGIVPLAVPGSMELAKTTATLMELYNSVIWAHHGIIVAAKDFDLAFGLVQVIEKASEVYLKVKCAANQNDDVLYQIDDNQIQSIANKLNLNINDTIFLD